MKVNNPKSIGNWLDSAIGQLSEVGIRTARLDCLVLLEDALDMDRSYILADLERELSQEQLQELNSKLEARKSRTPLAYIRGVKEFYGLEFIVSPDALIPRPETEDIIDIVNSLDLGETATIADIGTGSGNIAITVAKDHPDFKVYAYDIDQKALKIAKQNAAKHDVDIHLSKSDLLSGTNQQFDVIIANLPYVDQAIPVEPEVNTEPASAIFAPYKGLKLIKQLIEQVSSKSLISGGWLILESHEQQHSDIEQLCMNHGLILKQTKHLIQAFKYSG